jgi:hypothetical protein
MPKLSEALFGKKGKVRQKSTLSPIQQELEGLLSEGIKTGEGALGDLFAFNEQNFQEGVSKPAIEQFQNEVLPGILEKFAGQGSMGSGLRRNVLKAGQGLQSNLAQLRYQAQQQGQQNKLQGVNTLLGKNSIENIYKPGSEGLVQGAVKGFAQGAGTALGGAIAG